MELCVTSERLLTQRGGAATDYRLCADGHYRQRQQFFAPRNQSRHESPDGVNPKTETLGMNALPIKREDEWEIGDGIAGSSNSR